MPLQPEGEAHGTWGHTDTLLQLDDWLQAKLQRQVGGAPRGSHAPIVCVQAEGDLIYLPSAWSHATINVGETLALARTPATFYVICVKCVSLYLCVSLCVSVCLCVAF